MKKFFALLLASMMLFGATALADTLYVATSPDYPPFEMVDDSGAYIGYDMEMIAAVAEKAGMELEIVPMVFDSIVNQVLVDPTYVGVSGMSITEERLLSVNMSDGYIDAGLVVILKEGSTIKTPEDLKGKMVGVQTGTTSDFAAEELGANVQRFQNFQNAIQEVAGGKVDAAIVDKPVGQAIMEGLNDATLYMVDMGLQSDFYGIAVNKDNTELLDKINAALKALVEEGFFAELDEKYGLAAE